MSDRLLTITEVEDMTGTLFSEEAWEDVKQALKAQRKMTREATRKEMMEWGNDICTEGNVAFVRTS